MLTVTVVECVVAEEAHAHKHAKPAVDRPLQVVSVQSYHEGMGREDEAKPSESDQIGCHPKRDQAIHDRIAERALKVGVVQAVARASVLPGPDVVLELWVDMLLVHY